MPTKTLRPTGWEVAEDTPYISCKYCNARDLHWSLVGEVRHPHNYVLRDDAGKQHHCQKPRGVLAKALAHETEVIESFDTDVETLSDPAYDRIIDAYHEGVEADLAVCN